MGTTGYLIVGQDWIKKTTDKLVWSESQENTPVTIVGQVNKKTAESISVIAENPYQADSNRSPGRKVELKISKTTTFLRMSIDKDGVPSQIPIKAHTLKKKDLVTVVAELDPQGRFKANRIMVSTPPKVASQQKVTGYTGGTVINGTLGEFVNGGFKLIAETGETICVSADGQTKLMIATANSAPKTAILEDLARGDRLSIMGARLNKDELKAKQVMCVR